MQTNGPGERKLAAAHRATDDKTGVLVESGSWQSLNLGTCLFDWRWGGSGAVGTTAKLSLHAEGRRGRRVARGTCRRGLVRRMVGAAWGPFAAACGRRGEDHRIERSASATSTSRLALRQSPAASRMAPWHVGLRLPGISHAHGECYTIVAGGTRVGAARYQATLIGAVSRSDLPLQLVNGLGKGHAQESYQVFLGRVSDLVGEAVAHTRTPSKAQNRVK